MLFKRTYCKIIIVASMLFPSVPLMAQKGSLFIIGGGTRSPELIKSLVKTASMKANDYIIVLPMATAEPEASFDAISKQLAQASKNAIGSLNFNSGNVNDKKWLDSLSGARLIYIVGGDQTKFMKVVVNTPVYQAIHKAYQNGATVAGTSAGAAVMSKQMITGTQLKDTVYKETFNKLWTENIEFEEGLGLLDSAIIDQHFLKRSRLTASSLHWRLIPNMIALGLMKERQLLFTRS